MARGINPAGDSVVPGDRTVTTWEMLIRERDEALRLADQYKAAGNDLAHELQIAVSGLSGRWSAETLSPMRVALEGWDSLTARTPEEGT